MGKGYTRKLKTDKDNQAIAQKAKARYDSHGKTEKVKTGKKKPFDEIFYKI